MSVYQFRGSGQTGSIECCGCNLIWHRAHGDMWSCTASRGQGRAEQRQIRCLLTWHGRPPILSPKLQHGIASCRPSFNLRTSVDMSRSWLGNHMETQLVEGTLLLCRTYCRVWQIVFLVLFILVGNSVQGRFSLPHRYYSVPHPCIGSGNKHWARTYLQKKTTVLRITHVYTGPLKYNMYRIHYTKKSYISTLHIQTQFLSLSGSRKLSFCHFLFWSCENYLMRKRHPSLKYFAEY